MTDSIDKARERGVRAAGGFVVPNCPYPTDSAERVAWLKGYADQAQALADEHAKVLADRTNAGAKTAREAVDRAAAEGQAQAKADAVARQQLADADAAAAKQAAEDEAARAEAARADAQRAAGTPTEAQPQPAP